MRKSVYRLLLHVGLSCVVSPCWVALLRSLFGIGGFLTEESLSQRGGYDSRRLSRAQRGSAALRGVGPVESGFEVGGWRMMPKSVVAAIALFAVGGKEGGK